MKENRKKRTRFNLKKVSKRNRLSVFKSNNHLYAQVIDDNKGTTIVSASTLEKNVDHKKSISKGVKEVAFDKGQYKFHGLIKILADAARNEGLNF